MAEVNEHDPVNHPRHYTSHPSGIEAIDVCEHMGFCLGNAFKYVFRREGKHDTIEDLRKARWYVDREISRRSTEVWKTLPYDSHYEISSAGRVREKSGQLRRITKIAKNYRAFTIGAPGSTRQFYLHRAVVESFHGPIPAGMWVRHLDGDPSNNAVWNLRTDSPQRNHLDKLLHGTHNEGERNGQAVLTIEQVREIRSSNQSVRELAHKHRVSRSTIGRVLSSESWTVREFEHIAKLNQMLKHESDPIVRDILRVLGGVGLNYYAILDRTSDSLDRVAELIDELTQRYIDDKELPF